MRSPQEFGWQLLDRPPRIVVTGATGFIGAPFVAALLRAGHEVTVLARGSRDDVARAIGQWTESRDLERLGVVRGDVTIRNCGIDHSPRSTLFDSVDEVWNLAAATDFGTAVDSLQHQVNCEGTRNVLQLADEIGAPHFVQVSTLSICDRAVAYAKEAAVPTDRTFRNPYEASKAAAEQLVLDAALGRIGTTTIVRLPLTTVHSAGKGPTAKTPLSQIAAALQEVLALSLAESGTTPLWVPCGRDATMNMLPVDVVVDTLMRIGAGRRSRIEILHLRNGTPPRVRDLGRYICRSLGVREVAYSDPGSGRGTPSLAQRLLTGRLRSFLPYLAREPSYSAERLASLIGPEVVPSFCVTEEYVGRVLASGGVTAVGEKRLETSR